MKSYSICLLATGFIMSPRLPWAQFCREFLLVYLLFPHPTWLSPISSCSVALRGEPLQLAPAWRWWWRKNTLVTVHTYPLRFPMCTCCHNTLSLRLPFSKCLCVPVVEDLGEDPIMGRRWSAFPLTSLWGFFLMKAGEIGRLWSLSLFFSLNL